MCIRDRKYPIINTTTSATRIAIIKLLQSVLARNQFPLEEQPLSNSFIKRLQGLKFENQAEQNGFIQELLNLLKDKRIPYFVVYSKLSFLLKWHRYLPTRSRIKVKSEEEKAAKLISTAWISFIEKAQTQPASLDTWHVILVLLQKHHPGFIAKLLVGDAINLLSKRQLQSLEKANHVKLATFVYFFHLGKTLSKGNTRIGFDFIRHCLLYTSPSPRDLSTSRMPSSA